MTSTKEEAAQYRAVIGRRIEEMIERNKLQKRQVAEHIGVTPPNINNYIRGEIAPQPHALVKMARLFHTSVDYLTGKTDNPAERDESGTLDVDTLAHKIWKYKGIELTEEEKEKLVQLIKNGLELLQK